MNVGNLDVQNQYMTNILSIEKLTWPVVMIDKFCHIEGHVDTTMNPNIVAGNLGLYLHKICCW